MTARHEVTYYKDYDRDPASMFDIHSIGTSNGNILYVALAHTLKEGSLADIAELWSGVEVSSEGSVHTVESHGNVADMTTAMLAQVAFLQLRLDRRAAQEHEVRAITPEPESYERVLGMKVETVGKDGKTFLSGTVEDVLAGAGAVLNDSDYKMQYHRPRPIIAGGFKEITTGE